MLWLIVSVHMVVSIAVVGEEVDIDDNRRFWRLFYANKIGSCLLMVFSFIFVFIFIIRSI